MSIPRLIVAAVVIPDSRGAQRQYNKRPGKRNVLRAADVHIADSVIELYTIFASLRGICAARRRSGRGKDGEAPGEPILTAC